MPSANMKDTIESPTITSASFEELTREILVRLGEQPDRDGVLRLEEAAHPASYQVIMFGKR